MDALGWLSRLTGEVDVRRPQVERLWRYYDGDHPLGFATEKYREAFGQLFAPLADNWLQLVVDAVEERLDVEGFRVGDDPDADDVAWELWQRNQLDARSQLAHLEALVAGVAYCTVWFGTDGPDVTVEPAAQARVVHDPKTGERLAGVRVWADAESGVESAELFLPEQVVTFRRKAASYGKWERTDSQPNPLGVVPMVELANRPRLWDPRPWECRGSELSSLLPVQDAINKLVGDMLVAAEFAAMPQRFLLGYEPDVDANGRPLPPLASAAHRWFLTDQEDVQVGQFQAADLGNYTRAVETLVQHLASMSRTPPHYFYMGGNFPSGEALRSAEAGLVAKARRKQRHFGEAWEEVCRLMLRVAGDDRDVAQIETMWRDPETRTESEHIDALVKLKALNVPDEPLWERAGFTPTEIGRFRQRRVLEMLLAPAPVAPEPEADAEPEQVEAPEA